MDILDTFIQSNKDNSLVTMSYVDFEKEKGKLFRSVVLTLVNITERLEEATTDKIELETEASDLSVFPGKPGFVMIAEYSYKKKEVNMRLEPINY